MQFKMCSNPKVGIGGQQPITAVLTTKVEAQMNSFLWVLTYILLTDLSESGHEKIN